jgi:phosphomannomutase
VSKRGFDATILREYDIRGIVGETLSEDDAELLGLTFGTYAGRGGARAIAVGYDGRISSPGLAAALGKGLMQSGQNVFYIGRGPTPMLYFSTFHLPVDGGVMITGSHNPPEYNGFKMSLQKEPFFGEAIQSLAALARESGLDVGGGVETHCSVFDAYIDRLVQDFEPGRALKVAWDAGNGAAGETLVALTARLPGEHILLFEEIDGTFPNHHPDPTVPANLTTLRETVLEHGCDLGIAFDGDGDRIGAIDETGEILWGDQIMLLLARDVLAGMPGAPIIADVKASQVLFDGIEAMGGKPRRRDERPPVLRRPLLWL